MDDLNTRDYLEKIKEQVFENLRNTAFTAPSVQQQRGLNELWLFLQLTTFVDPTAIPKLPRDDVEMDEDLDDPDSRKPRKPLLWRWSTC